MNTLTVNLVVEVNGKTYKASSGGNLSGIVTDKDVARAVDHSMKQVMAQALPQLSIMSINAFGYDLNGVEDAVNTEYE